MSAEATLLLAVSRIVAWGVTYALHSTFILGGAFLLAHLAQLREVRAADGFWKAALLASVLTASFAAASGPQPLGGSFGLPMAMLEAPQERYIELVVPTTPGDAAVVRRWTETEIGSWRTVLPGRLTVLVFIAWVVGATLRLGRFGGAHVRLRRQLRRRRLLSRSELDPRVAEVLDRIPGGARVSVYDGSGGPIALAGEICLPTRVIAELSVERQRAVLAHEVAHLLRRDPYWLAALGALRATLFFQPLNSLALRTWREGAEYLCDDWAVREVGRPLELARSLAQIAAWTPPTDTVPSLSAVLGPGSSLVRRIERLVQQQPHRSRLRTRLATLALLLLLPTAVQLLPRVKPILPIPREFKFEETPLDMPEPAALPLPAPIRPLP